MNFLSKFDINQVVGLVLVFSAIFDKFFILAVVMKKLENPGFQVEEEIKKKQKFLVYGINSGATVLALLGLAFLFRFIKI